MARSVCSGFVLLALALGTSCDTDEPLQVGRQNASVEIIPNAAQVDLFRVWDVTEDSDGVPGPDDVNGDGVAGDVSLWCEFDSQGSAPSVPWTYAVKIRVVRADDNQPRDLTTPEAATAEFNRGSYDSETPPHSGLNPAFFPLTHVRGACSDNDQIRCNPAATSAVCQANDAGTCETVFGCSADPATICDPGNLGDICKDRGAGFCTVDGFCAGNPGIPCEASCADLQLGSCVTVTETRTFRFSTTNRRRLSGANRELLETGSNFIFDACIDDPACTAQVDTVVGAVTPTLGLCPGQGLGDPGLDPGNPLDLNSDPTIFGLQLEKGDRVVVEARRSDTVPGGGQVITFHGFPGIRARLSVDGIVLQADEVQCAEEPCNLSSEVEDPSPNISFSFTTR